MKALLVCFIVTTVGGNALGAQRNDSFTEAEIFQALHWGMPDSTARTYARFLADDPSQQSTIPEFRDLGPMYSNFSESFLLLLSLVSDDANRKVEHRLVDIHGGHELTTEQRSEWEARRSDYRNRLVKAGKLPGK